MQSEKEKRGNIVASIRAKDHTQALARISFKCRGHTESFNTYQIDIDCEAIRTYIDPQWPTYQPSMYRKFHFYVENWEWPIEWDKLSAYKGKLIIHFLGDSVYPSGVYEIEAELSGIDFPENTSFSCCNYPERDRILIFTYRGTDWDTQVKAKQEEAERGERMVIDFGSLLKDIERNRKDIAANRALIEQYSGKDLDALAQRLASYKVPNIDRPTFNPPAHITFEYEIYSAIPFDVKNIETAEIIISPGQYILTIKGRLTKDPNIEVGLDGNIEVDIDILDYEGRGRVIEVERENGYVTKCSFRMYT